MPYVLQVHGWGIEEAGLFYPDLGAYRKNQEVAAQGLPKGTGRRATRVQVGIHRPAGFDQNLSLSLDSVKGSRDFPGFIG
jgi:hypothetical protein